MSQENATSKERLIRYVNRQQMSWRALDVEKLIGDDHPARAIWTLVGRLDLSRFYESIESSVEEGGRPAFDPQLLISLWVYAYSEGIGSAGGPPFRVFLLTNAHSCRIPLPYVNAE